MEASRTELSGRSSDTCPNSVQSAVSLLYFLWLPIGFPVEAALSQILLHIQTKEGLLGSFIQNGLYHLRTRSILQYLCVLLHFGDFYVPVTLKNPRLQLVWIHLIRTVLSLHPFELNPMESITKNFAYWVLVFVYKLSYWNNGIQIKFLILVPCLSLNFKALKYAQNCFSLFLQLFSTDLIIFCSTQIPLLASSSLK